MSIVETTGGRLAGIREKNLLAFRGIPFARPPVGALRFCPPQPPEPWAGVRDASSFGPSAPQAKVQFDALGDMDVGEQEEDCLYLNVYTPAADGVRRPVMVWIHGGAFVIGSGSQAAYDVRSLVRRGDVVAVSINYRLGALGFLDLGPLLGAESGAAANCGLLDQVQALRWVQGNIEAFGGDPGRVTVFGESAGGMSVGTLLGTPDAEGLFTGAIAQSGAAHRINRREQAARVAERMLDLLGLGREEAARIRELPAAALLEAQAACAQELERQGALRAFCPTIDGVSLPRHPIEEVRAGRSRQVASVIGTTRDEWNLFSLMDPQIARLDEAGLLERVEVRVPGRGRELVEAYRRARPELAERPDRLFLAIETDRIFRLPAIALAEAQSAAGADTFAYLMSWESPLLDLGACHGIDIPFVFGQVRTPGGEKFTGGGPEAEDLSARMMEAWLSFAKTGDPNHADLPDWPRYDARRRATMILDRQCRVDEAPQEAERAAWEGLF